MPRSALPAENGCRRRPQRRVLFRDTRRTYVGHLKKVCRELRHVMGSFERPKSHVDRFGVAIRSCMNVIPSSIDKTDISEGSSNQLRVRSSVSRRMQRPVTLTEQSRANKLDVTSKSKRKAATLGRTTDLRIIAETAIPRSTTELQQLVKHNLINSK